MARKRPHKAIQQQEIEMIRVSGFTLFTLAFLAPAFGQSANPATPAPGNPGGMSPTTRESAPGKPAPHQINQADRTFVRAVALGGLAEVDLAKLAAQKASNDAVKEFAQRMIKDHGEANDRLASLAKANGISLPDQFDSEQRSMRDRLQQAGKTEFDHAYIRGQITNHQQTVQLLIYQIGSGENDDLKAFASDTLPIVLDHLRMAQSIAAQISGAAQASPSDQSAPAEKRPTNR
jgi:putative membrane protein